jgi:hypothetical protein
MWKALRLVCGTALGVAMFGLLFAVREHPRDFRPNDWRPYVDRVAESPYGRLLADEETLRGADLRPLGAWSPDASIALLALHPAVTLSLAVRAALRLRALRALHAGGSARYDAPYRDAAQGAPADTGLAAATRTARVGMLTFAAAAALPCVTSMGEVITLRAAGVLVAATPTEVGWYQTVRRDGQGSRGSFEHHGVRARAVVGGRAVALEARCGFSLTQHLDAGVVGPPGVPFLVWPTFPSVHQIGEAPVVGRIAGWAHVAFLAALAYYAANAQVERRLAARAPIAA